MNLIITIACITALVFFSAVLYGRLRKFEPSRPLPLEGQAFPDGFLWATGEDAYQHEGGNFNNDWARWEATSPSPIDNGDRCGRSVDFYNRHEEDFLLSKRDGHNAHRIGVEWSRLEPAEGVYDEQAFAHYGKMLASMKEKGFAVFLNLWHFTLPLWAADLGGFENPGVRARWEEFVRRCAVNFAPYVDYWSTMIDAQIYALAGYGVGDIPPNRKDMKAAMEMYRTLVRMHGRACHIIKKHARRDERGVTVEPRVGMIYFFFYFQPRGFFLDRLVYRQMDDIFNWNMLDALHTGTLKLNVLGGPSITETSDDYKNTLDWIGINYYTREVLSFSPFTPGFIRRETVKGHPATDMGWEIYPEGLYRLCKKISARYPGVPLIIAESGLADEQDRQRPRFIVDHLLWTHKLIDEGVPVKGYTYWSLTDNWEWAHGFWPKFGLYRVATDTLERKETRSARLYRFIASNNRLPTEEEFESL